MELTDTPLIVTAVMTTHRGNHGSARKPFLPEAIGRSSQTLPSHG